MEYHGDTSKMSGLSKAVDQWPHCEPSLECSSVRGYTLPKMGLISGGVLRICLVLSCLSLICFPQRVLCSLGAHHISSFDSISNHHLAWHSSNKMIHGALSMVFSKTFQQKVACPVADSTLAPLVMWGALEIRFYRLEGPHCCWSSVLKEHPTLGGYSVSVEIQFVVPIAFYS